MKTKITAVALSLLALTAFTPNPDAPSREAAPTTYKVDTHNSSLTWTGRKVTGEHQGKISLTDGVITAEGNTIKSGTFTFDVAGLTVTDLTDSEYNTKLVNHLKSDDFFSVQKHPKASFTITSVTPKGGDAYDVKGKLTIKGITNEISFPAVVKTQNNQLTAAGKATIDRTKYDIKFKSASFFENLGDKAIHDDFELDFKLVGLSQVAAAAKN